MKKIDIYKPYVNFRWQKLRASMRKMAQSDWSSQGEGRVGVETAIHRASPSVMRASRGVRRSNCKQIWLRVYDPSEGMLKLLLYKILLV
jgi:hypothetical protein